MTLAISLGATLHMFAQQAPPKPVGTVADFDAHRPPLAFRAEWKRQSGNAPQHPLVQDDLLNPDLEVKVYGGKTIAATTCMTSLCPYGIGVIWVQHAKEPTYAWSGVCATNCAVAFKDRRNGVDMTGESKIRWRSMQAGFHLLRPILKLGDGTWVAADHVDGATVDWKESDITIADLRWRRLDMTKVVEGPDGKWADHLDFSNVDEIGFTDLAVGADHGKGGSSRVAWVEVYGKPVPRAGKTAAR